MNLSKIGATSAEYKEKIKRPLFTASNVPTGSTKDVMARMLWSVVSANKKLTVNCL